MTNIKLSKRLKCIADMIDNDKNVIDVGCDHGFLDIFLTITKNCKCVASDVSENVLKNTMLNVDKYRLSEKIPVVCSDGLVNLDINKEDVIVISGMGTNTILEILNNPKVLSIDSLIVQSNNEIELLRKNVIKKGFYIYDEKIVEDNKKNYVIIYFKRGYKKYNKYDYLFGPIARYDIKNQIYFNKLYEKNKMILNKIPNKYTIKKIRYYSYLYKLKKFTCMKV